MWTDFQLSGLHSDDAPERKSKQCFRQVHDVVQKQQTFDSRAGDTEIELGEEQRIKRRWERECPWSDIHRASSALSSTDFKVLEGLERAGKAEGVMRTHQPPNAEGGQSNAPVMEKEPGAINRNLLGLCSCLKAQNVTKRLDFLISLHDSKMTSCFSSFFPFYFFFVAFS